MAFAKAVSENPEKLSECVRVTTYGLMMMRHYFCEGPITGLALSGSTEKLRVG